MRRFVIASLALIACGGAAPAPQTRTPDPKSDEARLDRALTGLTAGKPIGCISQFRPSFNTQAIGDVILYKVNNRLIYRNNTGGGCGSRSGFDTLVVRNFGPQLCRGTIINTVDLVSGAGTGGCTLGDFIPYTKPKSKTNQK